MKVIQLKYMRKTNKMANIMKWLQEADILHKLGSNKQNRNETVIARDKSSN